MHFPSSALAVILPLASLTSATLTKRQDEPSSSCTSTSFDPNFQWTVEDFDYHASYIFTNPAHQNSWGYASFNLTNPAFDEGLKASCQASSNQLSDFFYGTVSYNCEVVGGGSDNSSGISSTSFRYSYPSGELDIAQTWGCDSASFNATGSVTLDLDCTDKTWQNPDWQEGETYSDRTIKCGLVTVPVDFSVMTITKN